MSDGAWVVLGAAIGMVGSVATTWLNAHFARLSKYPKYDRSIEQILLRLLRDGQNWRSLNTLSNVTGLTPKHTKEYLIEIGARGSETNPNLWGLIERNPLDQIKPQQDEK